MGQSLNTIKGFDADDDGVVIMKAGDIGTRSLTEPVTNRSETVQDLRIKEHSALVGTNGLVLAEANVILEGLKQVSHGPLVGNEIVELVGSETNELLGLLDIFGAILEV